MLGAALALAGGAPGTVTIARDGFPVVACGVGGLRLLKLQRPGKSAQAADAFLRGFALPAGTVLPSPAVVAAAAGRLTVPRYKIIVEYDGGPFVGWQRQDNGPSIQAALEDAVFALLRRARDGAGRGPHRCRRPCAGPGRAFRSRRREAPRGGARRAQLPSQAASDRRALGEIAPTGFHARFSATWRRYRYRILNRRTPAALERGHVWHVPVPLDTDAMAGGGLGADRQARLQQLPLDRLPGQVVDQDARRCSPSARSGEEIAIEVGARSFLHNQVRILVGTLQLVGRGQWTQGAMSRRRWPPRDRTRAGPTAPPHGLCLMEVRYDLGRPATEATPRKRLTMSDRK